VVFNIHNQTGGVINNVEGDQHIRGGQHGRVPPIADVRQAVQELRTALRASNLDDTDYESVREYLNEIDSEIKRGEPARESIADRLTKITEIVGAAGTLASLAGPIQTIVAWLGSLGQPIAKLLGAS
jgi:hypothetical protein